MLEIVILLIALIIVASHPAIFAAIILLGLAFGFLRFVLRIWVNGFQWGFRCAIVLLILLAFAL